MTDGYREFEFNLPEALLTELVTVITDMVPAPLAPNHVGQIPEAQGVYQLFWRGQLVYIGKTDADAGLRKRLHRHAGAVQQRRKLDPAEVSFKAVRVFVFTAMDLEAQLIDHYGGVSAVPWNGSGFGANDPGRERDTTNVRPEGFDAQFPVDVDLPIEQALPSPAAAAAILNSLKEALPYTFRLRKRRAWQPAPTPRPRKR